MDAILDTNFIVSSVKEKIDFVNGILFFGFRILVPIQVIKELEKLSNAVRGQKVRDKQAARIGLEIIKNRKFKIIDLGINYVDKGIVSYAELHPDVTVATLDRELIKLPNRKIIIRAKKKLE